MDKLKKLAWIVPLVIVAAYLWNDYQDNEEKKAKLAAERRVIQESVHNLASRSGAVTDWEEKLSGEEGIRLDPVLTAELQQLWIGSQPILFIGTIEDISVLSKEEYVISIIHDEMLSSYIFVSNPLGLRLRCHKELAEPLLRNIQKDKDALFKGVAIIARIDSISTERYVANEEGGTENAKIGHGECIDVLYLGDKTF